MTFGPKTIFHVFKLFLEFFEESLIWRKILFFNSLNLFNDEIYCCKEFCSKIGDILSPYRGKYIPLTTQVGGPRG